MWPRAVARPYAAFRLIHFLLHFIFESSRAFYLSWFPLEHHKLPVNTSKEPLFEVVPVRREHEAAVRRVWIDGLPQTLGSVSWRGRWSLWRRYCQHSFDAAVALDGDMRNIKRDWADKPGRMALAAVVKSQRRVQVVGCIFGEAGKSDRVDPKPTEKEIKATCKLTRLSVHPAWRREGVATALVRNLEDWARRQGLKEMTLLTLNVVAIRFYEKARYRTTGFVSGKVAAMSKLL
ncbi:unnamed protein product [Pedinophyceae sp. YPF-701]|nr:unnamed protein product [Pedinophyceae sp. YPF-701]